MKKLIASALIILGSCSILNAQSYKEKIYDYIHKYHKIALENKDKFNIPASIILAQGILESNAGFGVLADSANNHFGIKCKDQWLGSVFYKEDDDLDTLGNLILSCFRKYDSVEESFADHSLFLTSNVRYARLFLLDKKDYISWAEGLKACGYATAPHYAKTLIDLIDRFNLHVFDLMDAATAENAYNIYLSFIFAKDHMNAVSDFSSEDSRKSVALPEYYQGMFSLEENPLVENKN